MSKKAAATQPVSAQPSEGYTASVTTPTAWGAYQDALDAPWSLDRWGWAQLAESLSAAAQDLPSTSSAGRALYRASQDAYRRAGV
jgi:hypothetical protein